MGGRGYDLLECMEAIDPASCSYEEWVSVGMALHHEGYAADDWDRWSARDAARYHPGECDSKWRSFGSSPETVTGGTIVQMARDAGWEPPRRDSEPGMALSWDMDSVADDAIDPAWIESVEVVEPDDADWNGSQDLVDYLSVLFEPSEVVGYVTDAWQKDSKWIPSNRGTYNMTAGEIIERLARFKGDMASAIGEPNAEAGAWIRFNPLDGSGVKNDNVTEFRYALVESDEVDIDKQRGIIDEMELPVAALVHSGNKSLHAIVRVDARDRDEYRKRVDYLYKACERYGLQLDTQNKNPSRLSRMPGVWRGGQKQFLVATNIGRRTWDEWKEWIEAVNDDLPDPEPLSGVWDDLPKLADPLIDGVLRQSHKMLLAGPSKAGKSFALIELCVAIAEGQPWMGFQCTQGRVLYVNLELDRASCLHRFRDVYEAAGITPRNLASIDVWNLRGKSKPMDELAAPLIRRALKTHPIAIVIDPIYKIITGDENSADQMARFCNQFDRVCTEVGCAVIYCHHHSKGAQGGKRAMDRASGSGVFARDPDAQLDMIELELTDDIRRQQEAEAVCRACGAYLDAQGIKWRDAIGQDDQVTESLMVAQSKTLAREAKGSRCEKGLLDAIVGARRRSHARTAWRIEGTLREFPRFEPLNLWFDYPVHVKDASGVLGDVRLDDGQPRRKSPKEIQGARKERAREMRKEKVELLREAMEECRADGVEPTRKNVLERIGDLNGKDISARQVKDWTSKKSKWCPIEVDPSGEAEGLLLDTEMQNLLNGF